VCEPLESRQLLSIYGPVSSLEQLKAQPSIQVSPLAGTGPAGYSPQQIQSAYGVNQIRFSGGAVTGNGAGQTIAVIDAYNDPNIASDLARFDSQYGLPAPPSFVVKNLGATATDAGWALETSLDVEWAHALAPKANIVLVEAASSNLMSLLGAVSTASHLPGVSVVSMSWGTPEFWGEWSYDNLFTTPSGHNGVAYVASSGDSGAWYGPMYPSVSPNVLAVGGSALTLGPNNTYVSETGWSGSAGGFSGTDSYFSFYETAPSYQVAAQQSAGLNYGLRTTPDVAFNADPNSGVAVYDSVPYAGQQGWFQVGGTSAAAPAWAGLIAIADQGLATGGKGPLTSTQVLTQLYNLPSSDYHDVTSGFNGYNATPGYDLVTGLGTPKANTVIAGLLAANGVSEGARAATTSVTVIVTTTSTTTHRLDVTGSSGSGSASGAGSTTGSGASASGSAVATTTTIVSASSGQLAALPPGQALINQMSNSSAQAQGIQTASPAALSPIPLSPSTLGQGLQTQSVTSNKDTEDDSEASWLPGPVEPWAPPAPDSAPGEKQAPAAEPEPMIGPCLPPGFGDPARAPCVPYIDAALEQIGEGASTKGAEKAPPAPSKNDQNPEVPLPDRASFSVGAALLVASGYHLAARPALVRRRRWLPARAPHS
jgi:subtilase family serine protease